MNKTLKTIIWLVVIILIIWGIYALSSKEETSTESLKIGVIVPLSGEAASYGDSWQKATELAIDKIKEEHEVDINIIYEDSQFEASKAVTAAQKLINIDDVKAIVVGSSRETLAIAPLVNEKKILLMNEGNAIKLREAGDYVFQIYPSSLHQGKDLANFALKKGYEKVAILALSDDYGLGLSSFFTEKIEEKGKIVIKETFDQQGVSDFKPQLLKIKESNPDALLVFATNNQYPLILKQIKELDIGIPLLAGETFEDQTILDEAGELAEGTIFTTFIKSENQMRNQFTKAHENRFGEQPGPFSGGFYDNILLVSEALIKNSRDVESAKEWLYNLENWPGTTGLTTFDENGDTIAKSYTIMIVRDGQFVPYEE